MGLNNRLSSTYASVCSMLDFPGGDPILLLILSAHLPDSPLHRVEAVYIDSLYLNEWRCILVRTKIRKQMFAYIRIVTWRNKHKQTMFTLPDAHVHHRTKAQRLKLTVEVQMLARLLFPTELK